MSLGEQRCLVKLTGSIELIAISTNSVKNSVKWSQPWRYAREIASAREGLTYVEETS